MPSVNRLFSVAPMMDLTDRHARYLLRLISRHALLYTEMVTTGALLHGDQARHLRYNDEEHPIALQLGGSDPEQLAQCAKLAEQWGYDEVNLNCGCPSDRVQKGAFGACLMAEPQVVADSVRAMKEACSLDVTVKCRIGVDDLDRYEHLVQFTEAILEAGCETLIVHARKAWLKGLSPRENREIPPLDYPRVFQLKRDFPQLEIILNGGLTDLSQIQALLPQVDGVMVGRAAYYTPWLLSEVDRQLFHDPQPLPTKENVVRQYVLYAKERMQEDVPLSALTRHILGLYHSEPGARHFRRILSEGSHKAGASADLMIDALEAVLSRQADARSHHPRQVSEASKPA